MLDLSATSGTHDLNPSIEKLRKSTLNALNVTQMHIKKGVLYYDNTPYQCPIQLPTALQVLEASEQQIKKANAAKIHQGEQLNERGSKFTGYACEVTNENDINSAYLKMKMMHGKATHIMMAYRLTGCLSVHNQGLADNREHGGGRVILNYMKSNRMTNLALFVVRYYGGVKLGPDRFRLIVDVAKSANEAMINASFEEEG